MGEDEGDDGGGADDDGADVDDVDDVDDAELCVRVHVCLSFSLSLCM